MCQICVCYYMHVRTYINVVKYLEADNWIYNILYQLLICDCYIREYYKPRLLQTL